MGINSTLTCCVGAWHVRLAQAWSAGRICPERIRAEHDFDSEASFTDWRLKMNTKNMKVYGYQAPL
jgi:hypothetical protein